MTGRSKPAPRWLASRKDRPRPTKGSQAETTDEVADTRQSAGAVEAGTDRAGSIRWGRLRFDRIRAVLFRFVGIQKAAKMESMKTTIDIPEKTLADAMRFTGARTKKEAVVRALEEFSRQQRIKELVACFGTLDFASNDEIEAGDLEGTPPQGTTGRIP